MKKENLKKQAVKLESLTKVESFAVRGGGRRTDPPKITV